MRSLSVQVVGGAAAIVAAYAGAGIYALTINPAFSSLMLFVINYRQNPLAPQPGRRPSAGILVLGLPVFVPAAQLLQPQPRQAADGPLHEPFAAGVLRQIVPADDAAAANIAYVVSPVMHPIFEMNDLRKLADSYRKSSACWR